MPFAYLVNANIITIPEYASAPWRPGGFVQGVAISQQLNRVWHQGSMAASALAEFVMLATNQDVLDDGDMAGLADRIANAVRATGGGGGGGPFGVPDAPAADGVLYGLRNRQWAPAISLADLQAMLAGYLPLAGGVMTGGYITLANYPTDAMHAVPRDYVENRIQDILGGQGYVPEAPDSPAVFGRQGTPGAKAWVQVPSYTDLNNYLPITGGTIVGNPPNQGVIHAREFYAYGPDAGYATQDITIGQQWWFYAQDSWARIWLDGSPDDQFAIDSTGTALVRNQLRVGTAINFGLGAGTGYINCLDGGAVFGYVNARNGLEVHGPTFFWVPGVLDPVTIYCDQGSFAQLRYSNQNIHVWASGVNDLGSFRITDETRNEDRIRIDPPGTGTGEVNIIGSLEVWNGNLGVGSPNAMLWCGGSFMAGVNGDVEIYQGLHVWGNSVFANQVTVNTLAVGGNCNIGGAVEVTGNVGAYDFWARDQLRAVGDCIVGGEFNGTNVRLRSNIQLEISTVPDFVIGRTTVGARVVSFATNWEFGWEEYSTRFVFGDGNYLGVQAWIDHGNVSCTGYFFPGSDGAGKEDIEDYQPRDIDIAKLRVRRFRRKGDPQRHIGFIHQELAGYADELAPVQDLGNGKVHKGLDPVGVIAVAVSEIQQLKQQVAALKDALERRGS